MEPRPGDLLYVLERAEQGGTWVVEPRAVLDCHLGRRDDRAIVVTQDFTGRLEAWLVGADAFVDETDAHAEALVRNHGAPARARPGAARDGRHRVAPAPDPWDPLRRSLGRGASAAPTPPPLGAGPG